MRVRPIVQAVVVFFICLLQVSAKAHSAVNNSTTSDNHACAFNDYAEVSHFLFETNEAGKDVHFLTRHNRTKNSNVVRIKCEAPSYQYLDAALLDNATQSQIAAYWVYSEYLLSYINCLLFPKHCHW